ncbi:glycosyltransferase family 2 protein [Lachnospiraceae bacterium 66-29]
MKITPYKIKKGIRYFKHYGPKAFWNRLRDKLEPEDVPYAPWYEKYKAGAEELARQARQEQKFVYRPLVSVVVPCYQTPENYLRQMIDSVRLQSYGNWQLCLADATPSDQVAKAVESYCQQYSETRIVYRHLQENQGIAGNTNVGISMAQGAWIGLLDHDDLLAPNALYEMVAQMNQEPQTEALYSDEDQVEETRHGLEHKKPHFKPDFSPDLLRSNNYITHFFCVKRTVVEQAGGLRDEFEGAQDYDFILRCTEIAVRVGHVPKVLYHWRVHSNSTADNPLSKTYAYEAGQRALQEHLERVGQLGEVSQLMHFGFYRVQYPVKGNPMVSIIIPNKDQSDTLRRCIESLMKSSWQNYEVIIVENNSQEAETFQYYQELCTELGENYLKKSESGGQAIYGQGFLPSGQPIKVVVWENGFNYSAINNFGAAYAKGEFFVLLNNDIEIITKNWLEEMLGNCQRPEVGIVGARLYYPDNTIQHAGIVLGIDGIAANMFPGLRRGQEGYYHKAAIQLNYSAVTAACLMVSKEVYQKVQGLEEQLAVAFNDLDFCLRVCREGYLVVYDPFVEAYHYESKSRGEEDTKEKVHRFGEEIEFIRSRWIDLLKQGDPYYNPNFSLKKCNYALKP